MRDFILKGTPTVKFGVGMSKTIGEELKKAGVKKAMLVFDKGIEDAGIITGIIDNIKESNIQTVCFNQVVINPTDTSVEKAAKLANEEKADAVIGIGGGSSMDTAKTLSVYRYLDGPMRAYFDGYEKGDPSYKKARNCFLMVLPTTAGTGAEMTAGGVISDSSIDDAKRSFPSEKCLPDVAILDPLLSVTLDEKMTVATGLDSLCQFIECMTSRTRSLQTNMICGYGVETIWRNLPKVIQNPNDVEARGELLYCANLSLNNGGDTHLGHAIATAMGGSLHMVHGHACALVLPEIIRFCARFAEDEIRLIAEKIGLDPVSDTVADDIAKSIETLNKKFGICSPKERGLSKEIFLNMEDEVFGAQAWFLERMDQKPSRGELREMLERIYG